MPRPAAYSIARAGPGKRWIWDLIEHVGWLNWISHSRSAVSFLPRGDSLRAVGESGLSEEDLLRPEIRHERGPSKRRLPSRCSHVKDSSLLFQTPWCLEPSPLTRHSDAPWVPTLIEADQPDRGPAIPPDYLNSTVQWVFGAHPSVRDPERWLPPPRDPHATSPLRAWPRTLVVGVRASRAGSSSPDVRTKDPRRVRLLYEEIRFGGPVAPVQDRKVPIWSVRSRPVRPW